MGAIEYCNNDVSLQAFLQHLQLIASSSMFHIISAEFIWIAGLVRHSMLTKQSFSLELACTFVTLDNVRCISVTQRRVGYCTTMPAENFYHMPCHSQPQWS
jgi:hypothetical protein